MSKRIITAALAATALLATSAPVAAEWPVDDADYMTAYNEDRICYAHADNERGLIEVFDTFEVRWEINAGSTSNYVLPCVPTDCPDPYFLVSGNLCSLTDPFGHIPFEDGSFTPQQSDPLTKPADMVLTVIDTRGLIEPFTPAGYEVTP